MMLRIRRNNSNNNNNQNANGGVRNNTGGGLTLKGVVTRRLRRYNDPRAALLYFCNNQNPDEEEIVYDNVQAILAGNSELVHATDQSGKNALQLVCGNPVLASNLKLIKLLIKTSAELSEEDEDLCNPKRINKANPRRGPFWSRRSASDLLKVVDSSLPPTQAQILRHKSSDRGELALHLACKNASAVSADVMELLTLSNPSAVCTPDGLSQNLPLHLACSASVTMPVSIELILLLIQQWPESCQKPNLQGDLPLHCAVQISTPLEFCTTYTCERTKSDESKSNDSTEVSESHWDDIIESELKAKSTTNSSGLAHIESDANKLNSENNEMSEDEKHRNNTETEHKRLRQQLDIVEYLVGSCPETINVRNKRGLTPYKVAVESALTYARQCNRNQSKGDAIAIIQQHPIIKFLSSKTKISSNKENQDALNESETCWYDKSDDTETEIQDKIQKEIEHSPISAIGSNDEEKKQEAEDLSGHSIEDIDSFDSNPWDKDTRQSLRSAYGRRDLTTRKSLARTNSGSSTGHSDSRSKDGDPSSPGSYGSRSSNPDPLSGSSNSASQTSNGSSNPIRLRRGSISGRFGSRFREDENENRRGSVDDPLSDIIALDEASERAQDDDFCGIRETSSTGESKDSVRSSSHDSLHSDYFDDAEDRMAQSSGIVFENDFDSSTNITENYINPDGAIANPLCREEDDNMHELHEDKQHHLQDDEDRTEVSTAGVREDCGIIDDSDGDFDAIFRKEFEGSDSNIAESDSSCVSVGEPVVELIDVKVDTKNATDPKILEVQQNLKDLYSKFMVDTQSDEDSLAILSNETDHGSELYTNVDSDSEEFEEFGQTEI